VSASDAGSRLFYTGAEGTMKVLSYVFGAIWVLGFGANTLLFLYVEWVLLSRSFFQVFNPFLHFEVLWTLLGLPLFWMFLVVTGIGLVGMSQLEKRVARGTAS
jgi:hypothetical protein